jgi:hypothetical protein
MENTQRYNFGGFAFGTEGKFQLTIKQTKQYGHTIGFEIELTPAERLELINLLLTMNEKDNA